MYRSYKAETVQGYEGGSHNWLFLTKHWKSESLVETLRNHITGANLGMRSGNARLWRVVSYWSPDCEPFHMMKI